MWCDPVELKWTCHVCGSERPDNRISVFKRDISLSHGLPVGTVQMNIRYCNDRMDCFKGTETTWTGAAGG